MAFYICCGAIFLLVVVAITSSLVDREKNMKDHNVEDGPETEIIPRILGGPAVADLLVEIYERELRESNGKLDI